MTSNLNHTHKAMGSHCFMGNIAHESYIKKFPNILRDIHHSVLVTAIKSSSRQPHVDHVRVDKTRHEQGIILCEQVFLFHRWTQLTQKVPLNKSCHRDYESI